jgi:hypothetical protein
LVASPCVAVNGAVLAFRESIFFYLMVLNFRLHSRGWCLVCRFWAGDDAGDWTARPTVSIHPQLSSA